jgi:hypothetical protein
MVKALRQWLDGHELPAIIAGVLGVIFLLPRWWSAAISW